MATVVVIGGSSGIGLATASMLVKQGTYARVVIAGRDSSRLQTALKQLDQQQQQQQQKLHAAATTATTLTRIVGETVDATAIESIRQFYTKVGHFQHLVLAASGGEGAGPFEKVSEEAILMGMQLKLFPHFRCAQLAVAGGFLSPFASPASSSCSSSSTSSYVLPSSSSPSNLSLTFVTAASSRMALPGTSGLAAINGAIQCMIPTIAKELASRNGDSQNLPPIRVNAVSPGVIRTPWWNGKEQMLEASGGISPLKRVGEAEEVGHAILFLIENTFVTGIVVDVDGGAHLQ